MVSETTRLCFTFSRALTNVAPNGVLVGAEASFIRVHLMVPILPLVNVREAELPVMDFDPKTSVPRKATHITPHLLDGIVQKAP